MSQLKDLDIVCISSTDWEHPWGSRQQIMSRLALNNRVFYVEYQASFIHLFLLFTKKRIFKLFGNLRKINNNLFIYTPPLYFLPFGYYLRFINKLNQKLLSLQIISAIKKIGFKKPILWVYLPSTIDLIKYFNESIVVYHCIANFSQEKSNPFRQKTVMIMERELSKRANIIAAMTEGLYRTFSSLNTNVVYSPSAVDFKYFCENNNLQIPKDLKKVKRPILGIVGYLDAHVLDLDLLRYLVVKRPQWSLVLVGPIFRGNLRFGALQAKKNVYFLGSKKYTEIPAYIKFFDICLIPYKKNKFIENVSPLKLYEYLALGKPIVSTDFLMSNDYNGLICIAKDKENFIKDIENLLTDDNSEMVKNRIEMARANSWDNRLEKISQLIINYINKL